MTEEKRGRKSAAELEAVPDVSELPTPPPPPATLDDAGCERWREIVNEHGADRFRKSDLQLLEQLVRCEQSTATMDRNIELHGEIIGDGTRAARPIENPAVKVRDKLLRQTLALQVKLRLCPSTRMRADTAKLARGVKKKERPWAK
ncbi:hypothetical protein LCGC14_0424410 [marine sediment metagenome]|uniref:Terminase small subunit n=1 Tax=marine sediment metagenome TaxID=412755 RepID=A0A0F9SVV2_9ZZZZ